MITTSQEMGAAFCNALTKNMRHRGLSAEALANISGMSSSGIYKLVKGQSSPTLETLVKLSNALDVDLLNEIQGWRILKC